MGLLWIVFAVVVIVATTNAVNLTDGLDGLAIGSVMIVGVSLGIMTYLTGHSKIAEYLRIPYIPEAAELTVFLAALMGAAHRLSLVQQQPGHGVHGRHRVARARRHHRHRGGHDQEGDFPVHRRRGLRGRGRCR